ncbi:hypothetical protein BCR35DRAFT_356234 [Leucosporidium creatinivorum]|uniref:Uncharacterized protein n=1 Tax=Leucosporidium creatinivorum TaxID=106004 RepID=A0A1Y2CJG9_9BASI|nr:hypothetical protein BCR35DRAFT_356234 [Leucosporidium creatinivorum]
MPSPTARVALITGGSSGIGSSLVTHFLSKGYNVLIADLSPPPTGRAGGGEQLFARTDVTNHGEMVQAFRTAKERWGRVDVVGGIAGISQVFTDPEGKDPFLRSAQLDSEGDLDAPNFKVVQVNLMGVLNTVHVAVAFARAQDPAEDGARMRIVVAGSSASIYPFPNESLYGAAKHGVLGLVRSLAVTLHPQQIYLNAIAPSLVETGIGNPEAFTAIKAANCLTPMETIVRAVEVLTAPDSSLTGQIIECCLDHLSFRRPPRLMNKDEERCMGMIWPLEEIEKVLGVEESEEVGVGVVEG